MTTNMMSRIFKKSGGCNEDCLNCKYPDCYKPEQTFKHDESLREALKINTGKSRPNMFTVEIGGGHNTALINKKFYR